MAIAFFAAGADELRHEWIRNNPFGVVAALDGEHSLHAHKALDLPGMAGRPTACSPTLGELDQWAQRTGRRARPCSECFETVRS